MGSGFAGKVVFITGAAGRAGSATAEAFAVERASLGLIDGDARALAAVADHLRLQGVRVETVIADPSDLTSCKAAIGTLLDIFDRVDVVIAAREGASIRAPSAADRPLT